MGKFVVSKVTNLSDVQEGLELPESDFATMNERGQFVQMKFIDNNEDYTPIAAKPGVFTIVKTMAGMALERTEFTQTNILKEFVNTKDILDRCYNFFSRLNVYEKYKVFPKRGLLLYGPPGTGKSVSIAEVVNSVAKNPEYFVLVWHTDKLEAGDVKDFIKHLKFEGPTKMILVIEDIGGIEVDNARIRSESSLLALLDNQEKAFKIPTLILATTNYPENFMGNLTNRPGRFDEKIKVGYPSADAREKLLKHYDVDNIISRGAFDKIRSKVCEKFTPAQLQELIIRAALNERSPEDVINEMVTDMQRYEKAFQDPSKRMGLSDEFDD